jgi:hypothetical protein
MRVGFHAVDDFGGYNDSSWWDELDFGEGVKVGVDKGFFVLFARLAWFKWRMDLSVSYLSPVKGGVRQEEIDIQRSGRVSTSPSLWCLKEWYNSKLGSMEGVVNEQKQQHQAVSIEDRSERIVEMIDAGDVVWIGNPLRSAYDWTVVENILCDLLVVFLRSKHPSITRGCNKMGEGHGMKKHKSDVRRFYRKWKCCLSYKNVRERVLDGVRKNQVDVVS